MRFTSPASKLTRVPRRLRLPSFSVVCLFSFSFAFFSRSRFSFDSALDLRNQTGYGSLKSRESRATAAQREDQVQRRAAFEVVFFGGLVVGPVR